MHVSDQSIRHRLDPRRLEVIAQSPVPTEFGTFVTHVFRFGGAETEHGLSPDHVALTMGELRGAVDVPVRIHSECLTGEVFSSLKCDCKEQLREAQRVIAEAGSGAIIYLRQEGRGIGLANKIRAYALQWAGHDTVDANRLLGLPDDARDYAAAAAMLERLGVVSVSLMTNNPAKVVGLETLGVSVTRRMPVVVPTNIWSANYLEVKRSRMGHELPQVLVPGADAE